MRESDLAAELGIDRKVLRAFRKGLAPEIDWLYGENGAVVYTESGILRAKKACGVGQSATSGDDGEKKGPGAAPSERAEDAGCQGSGKKEGAENGGGRVLVVKRLPANKRMVLCVRDGAPEPEHSGEMIRVRVRDQGPWVVGMQIFEEECDREDEAGTLLGFKGRPPRRPGFRVRRGDRV